MKHNVVIHRVTGLGVVLLLAGFLTACGGDSGNSQVVESEDAPVLDDNSAANPDQANLDDESFDIAELFFTEVDREWLCDVTTEVSAFSDQLYVDPLGFAQFQRYGQADWGRVDGAEELFFGVASGELFTASEVFATNSVLQFRWENEIELPEFYDCVLISREVPDA